MNKCSGCGVLLQDKDKNIDGYTPNISNNLCERCFRIINYGDYKMAHIDTNNFTEMINEINKTKSLVVLVVDLFNFNPDLGIFNNLENDIILVLTKRDLLPKTLFEDKLMNYLKTSLKIVDKVVISSNKNYNFDLLYEKIKKHKKTSDVYVVGYTNTGKSTMINKMIKNYNTNNKFITTSHLPNTTLNQLVIDFGDFRLIDTPGVEDKGSIYYLLNGKELKRVTIKKTVKPVTYQVKSKQTILIDKYAILELSNNNITIFMSNLKIDRLYKNIDSSLEKHVIEVHKNEDVVLSGLGFIKFTKEEIITLYTIKGLNVYKRKSLI